jgi:hypothetical protein
MIVDEDWALLEGLEGLLVEEGVLLDEVQVLDEDRDVTWSRVGRGRGRC